MRLHASSSTSTSTSTRARAPRLLSAEAELARLDAHFTRVLGVLHRAPTRGLGAAQRKARSRHLEELERYQRRGRFPQNKLFRGRAVPHFIDAAGTRCAMGHLIERGGGKDLVHHVARSRNYATIAELADTPELLAWLEENGLTVSEAGLIQPSYCGKPMDCVCQSSSETVYEGDITVPAANEDASIVVSAIHGKATNVVVGDTISVSNLYAMDKDHVLVIPAAGGDAHLAIMVVDADGTIDVPPCLLNLPLPPDLPKATAIAALTSPDENACGLELAKHDPSWTQLQGDCGQVSSSSSGSTVASTSSGAGTTSSASTGAGAGGAGGSGVDAGGGGCSVGGGASGAELALALLAGVAVIQRRRR